MFCKVCHEEITEKQIEDGEIYSLGDMEGHHHYGYMHMDCLVAKG